MSHFTMVQTEIRNVNLLDSTMKTLGYKRAERSHVHGFRRQKTDADVVWETDNRNYDIGAIKQPDGTYVLIADWMMAGITQQKILQQYNIKNAHRRAKLMGHQVKNESQQPDGSIRLVIKTG